MILASCSKDHSTKPQTYALSGRVLLVGTLRNDVGDTLGVQRVEDADSVRVYLYQGASLRDSTRTTAGGYRFSGLSKGSYSVTTNLWGGIGDTVSIGNLAGDAAVDTMILMSSATLGAFPDPFSTSTRIRFAIDSALMVELSARKPSGLKVKTMVQQAFPAGLHQYLWDGTDDASNPLPPGAYWIFFKAGTDYRAMLVVES